MNLTLIRGAFLFALLSLTLSTKAQYALKLADEQYSLYNYFNAVDLYEKAYQKKPTLYTAQRLASSYHQMHDYKNEESWYAIAVKMGSNPQDVLSYAKALQNNSKYAEAKSAYQKYVTLDRKPDAKQLNLWIASCDSAIKWMQHPNSTMITNQVKLNSPAADWGAIVYNNNIIFASDRQDSTDHGIKEHKKPFLKFAGNVLPDKKIYGWTGNSYLKLYQTTAGDSVNAAPTLLLLGAGIIYHTGPATFDKQGNEIYFTIDNPKPVKTKTVENTETYKLKIFYALKDPSGKWQKPLPFAYNKTGASTGDPYITSDGKRLYFVSDMPGGKGGTDLYYCNKTQDGNWATPINLAELNTPGNERTPMADADGNIYYATDGNITMGGLDIYKATYVNNKFSGTQNLAYPVNSPQDDLAYQLTDNHTGYLTSDRIGGKGSDDIYKFSEKPPLVLKLEGIVYDKTTLKPLPNAVITLTSETYIMNYSPDSTGQYSFTLLTDNNYILYGKKTGYTSDSQLFNTNGIKTSQVIHKDLYLEKIKINKPIVLNNINYDFDKANIRADARPALDHLIEVMQQNPTIWIELSSHTDSRGSDSYNLVLSQRRAQAAVNYIVVEGKINPNRITAKGYGETRLLNDCGNGVKCTEEQHQANRRTEFKITKQ